MTKSKSGISDCSDRNNLQRMEVKGVKAFVRPETSDPFVVNEVIKGNEYRKLNIRPGDIIMDCGMNIGMFSIWALRKGASRIHSYEPSHENYRLAVQNIKLNGYQNECETYEKALVGTSDKTRKFSLNNHKNKGAHSLVEKKGRDSVIVQCVNFQDELKRIRPQIVKMDIEGGEYECLLGVTDFGNIREFVMEFHHAHLNDIYSRAKYKQVIDKLKEHFVNVDYREDTKKAWVTIIFAWN